MLGTTPPTHWEGSQETWDAKERKMIKDLGSAVEILKQANGVKLKDGKLPIPHVIKSVCDCEIPYFPTGNIKWCSKCNRKTVY
ncbi:MAG: hypothetical protein ACOCVN_03455 [bacterium]